LVSCQFALHYSFENEISARNFINNVACRLKDGGYFIGTMPNEDIIKRRIKNKEEMRNRFYQITYNLNEIEESPGFGQKYNFFLEDAVDNVPEYLVDFNLLIQIANEVDLELVERKSFHEFYVDNIKNPEYEQLLEKMLEERHLDPTRIPIDNDLREIAELYVVFAFRKKRVGLQYKNMETFWDEFREQNSSTKGYYKRELNE